MLACSLDGIYLSVPHRPEIQKRVEKCDFNIKLLLNFRGALKSDFIIKPFGAPKI